MIKRRSPLNVFSALGIGLSTACLALACGNSDSPAEDENTGGTGGTEVTPDTVDECVENPYLEDCPDQAANDPDPIGGTGGTSGTGGTVEKPKSATELAKEAAQNLLKSKCGACHGSQLSDLTAEAGMNYIDDLDQLAKKGKIIPLNSGSSPIIQRMKDGTMPKGGPRVADADIAVIAAFIDSPDYWPDAPKQVCDNNPPLSFDQLYASPDKP